jgi:Flp pilus assembly protein TadD
MNAPTPHREELLRTARSASLAGRYDEAERILRELLDADPDWVDAHQELGRTFGFRGEFNESIIHLRRALELAPERFELRGDLAMTYSILGRQDDAVAVRSGQLR